MKSTNHLSRRDFLRNSVLALGAAGVASPLLAAASAGEKPASALELVIVHTTDVHSWLEPVTRGAHAGLGGVAARAGLVRELRRRHPNLLLLDSGDILMGTPYFTLYEGEPEFRSMSAMGYDAASIGNHEFDGGIKRLAELCDRYANFPLLASCYDFSGTPMEGRSKPYIIRELDGARVGILGMNIGLEGLVPASAYGGTRHLSPADVVPAMARHLRHEERCDFIIGLSHMGLTRRGGAGSPEPGDRAMIALAPEIDIILSGHNHRLFEEPEVTDRAGNPGYVLQSGWGGSHLGVVRFNLYERGKREIAAAGPVAARGVA